MRRLSSDGGNDARDCCGGLPDLAILYSSIIVSMFFSFGVPMDSNLTPSLLCTWS